MNEIRRNCFWCTGRFRYLDINAEIFGPFETLVLHVFYTWWRVVSTRHNIQGFFVCEIVINMISDFATRMYTAITRGLCNMWFSCYGYLVSKSTGTNWFFGIISVLIIKWLRWFQWCLYISMFSGQPVYVLGLLMATRSVINSLTDNYRFNW